MRVALVLGSAACLHDDMARARALGRYDVIVAANEAAVAVELIDAWVSLHPDHFPRRMVKREAAGFTHQPRLFSHRAWRHLPITVTPWAFPGQAEAGTSGMFAAKVALYDLGCDRAVLCGIPMQDMPHFNDNEPWPWHRKYMRRWQMVAPADRARIRSMSGATADLLGQPDAAWLT